MSPSDEPPLSLWKTVRVLIWGKTYPELSSKYIETVCTGGTTEEGRFIRLYPIPFRYLSDEKLFRKYQWIEAPIAKSTEDPRPESYKIRREKMSVGSFIPPDRDAWQNRARVIFKDPAYQFPNAESLMLKHQKDNTSMGFVRPAEILDLSLEARTKEDYQDFKNKMELNAKKKLQSDLFESPTSSEIKHLEFVTHRFKVRWRCDNAACTRHNMLILDWEPYELVRNIGYDKAMTKVQEILNLSNYDLGFFLGNFRLHADRFAIGGIWYPKRSRQTTFMDQIESAD